MNRRDDEANRLDALVRSLFPDDATATDQEVSAFLEAMNSDVEGLRTRLVEAARELGAAERREQRSAPPYLRDVVTSLENAGSLPRELGAAASRAKEWLKGLMQPVSAPGHLTILEAYRKGDADLTEKDKETLDELADELRRKVEDDDKAP